MPKITIKDTTLLLSCKGGWRWQAGKELEVTVPGTGLPLTCSKSTALQPADLLEAILSEVPGQSYLHSPVATGTGSVSLVDASVDAGSPAAKVTVGGEPVATDATTGTFTIIAGQPSVQDAGNARIFDPRMIHSGTWKVKETPQEGLTECAGDGGAAEAAAIKVPAAGATPEATPAATAVDDATEPAEDAEGYRIELELRLSDDSLHDIWGPEMLPRGGLSLEIGAAQPSTDSTGLACRFRKMVLWRQLIAVGESEMEPSPAGSGSMQKSMKKCTATVILSPAEIDPSRPVWLSISGCPFGGKAELREEAIGQIALFTMVGSRETVVRPDRLPGFIAPKGHEDIWATAKTADGEGEEGAATALLRTASERLGRHDGWMKIGDAPSPPAPWSTHYRPVAHDLTLVDVDEGQCAVPRLKPLPVELTPLRPGLLAAVAVAERLEPKLEEFADLVADTFPAVTLATKLERFRLMGGVIGGAVGEGVDMLKPPNVIASLRKRSHGFVNDRDLIQTMIGPTTASHDIPISITPARLLLLCHFASMRDRSFALRDEAELLFGLLDPRCRADTPHDVDITAEQRRARLFLGPLALERGDVKYTGSPIESVRVVSPEWDAGDPVTMEEVDWAIKVTREISPDWQASERVTMLAARCFQTLSELDSRFRGDAPALGLGFSKGGGDPLLDIATHERWTRIVRQCLVEDQRAMLKAVSFRNAEMLPALHQLTEMIGKSRRIGYLLKQVRAALRGILKQRAPFNYTRQLTITRVTVIEGSIAVITKLVLRDTTIRKAVMDIVKRRMELRVHVWVMEGKKFQVSKFRLDPSKPIQVKSSSKIHLREQLKIIGSPRLVKILDNMGKAVDGFFAIVCVVDIVQRLTTPEKELDRIQDYAQLLNNFLILVDIGLRRLPKASKLKLPLGPLIAVVQSMITFATAYEALEEGRGKDAAREVLTGLLMLMMIPKLQLLVGISAAAGGWVILGAVLAIVVLQQILQSGAPEDIKVCAKRLTDHVAACAFGRDGFRALSESQPPRHLSTKKKELDWLARVETETCESNRNVADLDRITTAATAIAVEFKAATLSLDQCTTHLDWLNWFGATGQAAGYRLTIPGAAFLGRQAAGQQALDTSGRKPIFFQRDPDIDVGILIWLEHSTNGEKTEVVVQTGGRDDGPVCYADTGIGLSLVKREKDPSGRTPSLTLLVVVGTYSPGASARLTLPNSKDVGSDMPLCEIEILIAPDRHVLEPTHLPPSARLMLASHDSDPDYERRPNKGRAEKITLGVKDDRRSLYWTRQ